MYANFEKRMLTTLKRKAASAKVTDKGNITIKLVWLVRRKPALLLEGEFRRNAYSGDESYSIGFKEA